MTSMGRATMRERRGHEVKLQVTEMSRQMQDMREAMESNEQGAAMINALRGTNLNDDDAAAAGTTMQVVEMRRSVSDDSLPLEYDPEALSAYFSKRPEAVITRLAQLLATGGGWAVQTAFAAFQGKLTPGSEAEVEAVVGLRSLLVSLGPFYIKVGQALSIRPDILSPQAMVQLQQLCDKVPPFDSKIAMATIREELGCQVEDVYSKITPEPVAAASLGQVYKATLKETGDEVAVKVQRPFVLETVSLDLFLTRAAGQILRALDPEGSKRLDVVALLDEFASNFYRELDYELECANGIRLAKEMAVLPRVKIPRNYPEATARRVHTAEWVDGEKLSQSTADDVGELVNLGVITYLTQLLDTGFFHADPHPGNMLRAPDGRLVILDFGLMTEVTDDQRYGMIEAIAHLINRDYENIGDDFVNMDFIPRGVDTTPIVPALARVFDAALAGGGAKSINFQDLASDLAQITYEFPFRIPPYSALIIRAVSVLEGIALVGNPQFAIIDEAYPYLSRQLLTDDSPRMRAALRYMVYGSSGVFDVERMIDLLQALEKFVAVRDTGDGEAFKKDGVRAGKYVGQAGDAKGTKQLVEADGAVARSALDAYRAEVQQEQEQDGFLDAVSQSSNVEVVDGDDSSDAAADATAATREALQFFFSKDGELFRSFLLDEIVNAADALSRDALTQLVVTPATQVFDVVPDPFGILKNSRELANSLAPPLTDSDKKMLESIRKLIDFFLGNYDLATEGSASPEGSNSDGQDAGTLDRARALLPVLQENQEEMRNFGSQIVSRLTELQASRALRFASERIAPATVKA